MEKIKSLNLVNCPHCGKECLVEFETTPPTVLAVLTTKELETAKQTVIDRVLKSGLDEKTTNDIITWVRKDDVLFGPAEVEEMIKDILDKNGK